MKNRFFYNLKLKVNFTFIFICAFLFLGADQLMAKELFVYSARKEHLIKPVFEKYTAATGVKIKYLTDKDAALVQRLKMEGAKTQADLFITVDAGNLWFAAKEGLLAPVTSSVLTQNIPSYLRDPQNRWFGLSLRARTIAYNPKKVKLSELSTYEDLANLKWQGRLCLRTSKKVYNQSLVAMLLAEKGEGFVATMLKGWVKNLALPPFGDDTSLLNAIAQGRCDVGIVNTYYFGRLIKDKPNLDLKLFWPNQKDIGVHVNISGAGVVKASSNKKEAIAFLEWLSSAKAQNFFADSNQEYPVNPKVKAHPAVDAWGKFKAAQTPLIKAGELQTQAVKLMDQAGYR